MVIMNIAILIGGVVMLTTFLVAMRVAKRRPDWARRAMPYNFILIAICIGGLVAFQGHQEGATLRRGFLAAVSIGFLVAGIIALRRQHNTPGAPNDNA